MMKMRCGHEATARMFENDAEDAAMVPVCLTCLAAGNTLAFAVDPYDELMARRARLMDAWMEHVVEAQALFSVMTFWGTGVTLDSKGTLRMIAFAPNSWRKLWELECAEDGVVVFTSVDT